MHNCHQGLTKLQMLEKLDTIFSFSENEFMKRSNANDIQNAISRKYYTSISRFIKIVKVSTKQYI